jgi:hypothetical protein
MIYLQFTMESGLGIFVLKAMGKVRLRCSNKPSMIEARVIPSVPGTKQKKKEEKRKKNC